VLTAGDLESRTPLADLGRRPDIEAMVAQAVSVGRDGSMEWRKPREGTR